MNACPDDPARVRHLVVTVHGIRTYGHWQERLERLAAERLQDAAPEALPQFCHYKYGFFSLIAFYFAPTRWLQIRRFRRDLDRLISRHPNLERLDIFCHSFGTYLASWALVAKTNTPALPRIANLVLAGSLLSRTHPWPELLGDRVTRVVNECGDRDHVLLLNQLLVPFVGAGGLLGFQTFESRDFVQRYFQIGHSGYFEARAGDENWFLRRYWLPIICESGSILLEPACELRPLTPFQGVRLFLLNSSTFLKILLAGIIIACAFAYILGLYQNAERERRLAVARLAGAEAIRLARTVNDPTHDLPSAALLAVEALRRLPAAEAEEFLLQNAPRLAPAIAELPWIQTTALAQDEGRIAAASDGAVMLLLPAAPSRAARKTYLTLPRGEKILQLRFAGEFLVAQAAAGLFVRRLADDGALPALKDRLRAFALSPGRQSIALANADGNASIIPLQPGAAAVAVPLQGVLALDFASDALIVAATADALHVIDAGTGRISSRTSLGKHARDLRLDHDRQRVIAFLRNAGAGAGSDIEVFQLNAGQLIATGLKRDAVAVVDVTAKGGMVFGDLSGVVDTLVPESGGFNNNCFLHEAAQDIRRSGRTSDESVHPVPARIVSTPQADFAIVGAASGYPELRLFRFDLASGNCRRLGEIPGQVTDLRMVVDGKFVLVRDDGGGLTLLDVRSGVTVAQEARGWADTIESAPRRNQVYFTQGKLMRAISLDAKAAQAELCAHLGGKMLSPEQWRATFGTERRRPTC